MDSKERTQEAFQRNSLELSKMLLNAARSYRSRGDYDRTERAYQKALAIFQKASAAGPRKNLAWFDRNFTELREALKRKPPQRECSGPRLSRRVRAAAE